LLGCNGQTRTEEAPDDPVSKWQDEQVSRFNE
jgi:hypothetical protein